MDFVYALIITQSVKSNKIAKRGLIYLKYYKISDFNIPRIL